MLSQNNRNKIFSLKQLENYGVLPCQKSEGIVVLWEMSAQPNWSLLSWGLGERLVWERRLSGLNFWTIHVRFVWTK